MKRRPCLSTTASTVLPILAGWGWVRIRSLHARCAALSAMTSRGALRRIRPRGLDEDQAAARAGQRRARGILQAQHRLPDLARRQLGTRSEEHTSELQSRFE